MAKVYTEWWFICSECGEKVDESELSSVGWNDTCATCSNGDIIMRLND